MADSKVMTLDDLPRANKPGEAGVRIDSQGRVWIPWGLNVYSQEFASPQMLQRREWHMLERAGGRRNTAQVQVRLCKCSYCKFCIGRGYLETELYLRPVLGKDTIQWKYVCGGCATQEFDLAFGFCMIAHADWAGPYHKHIIREWATIYEAKWLRLEDEIVDGWNTLEAQAIKRWHGAGKSLKTYPRTELWNEFIATRRPEPATFTQLYPLVTSTKTKKKVA